MEEHACSYIHVLVYLERHLDDNGTNVWVHRTKAVMQPGSAQRAVFGGESRLLLGLF